MAHVITQACVGVKDHGCTQVCPCDCSHDAGDQLVIDPGACIDCGACVPACPVGAIYHEDDVPAHVLEAVERNRLFFP